MLKEHLSTRVNLQEKKSGNKQQLGKIKTGKLPNVWAKILLNVGVLWCNLV